MNFISRLIGVIAVSMLLVPSVMPAEVDHLIAQSAFPELIPVAVTIEGVVEHAEREAEERAREEAKLNAQQEEHKARVAKAKEEKAQALTRAQRSELKRLETKEILAKGALRRATDGTLNELDRLLTDKEALRAALIDRLDQDPVHNEMVQRIRIADRLSYGDFRRAKQLLLPLWQDFRLKELENIQRRIQQLEDELAVTPIFEATRMKVGENEEN